MNFRDFVNFGASAYLDTQAQFFPSLSKFRWQPPKFQASYPNLLKSQAKKLFAQEWQNLISKMLRLCLSICA